MHILLTFSYTLQYVMHFVIPGTHFNKPQSHVVTVFVSFYDNCVTLWYYFPMLCQTFKKDKCKASTNSGHSHSVKPWPFLLGFEPLTKSLKRVGAWRGEVISQCTLWHCITHSPIFLVYAFVYAPFPVIYCSLYLVIVLIGKTFFKMEIKRSLWLQCIK